MKIATAPRADSKRWTQNEITFEELASWTDEPALTKQCGNYVLGELKGSRRTKDTVLARSAFTLDADYNVDDSVVQAIELLGYRAVIHTTWRSTPEAPRYRIILPASRDMTAAEYRAAAQVLMRQLGEEHFDPAGALPEQYMFRPSAKSPETWQKWVFDEGINVDVDALLEGVSLDLSHEANPRVYKQDPKEIPGTVGAFNRAYSIQEAIDAFELPYDEVIPGELWTKRGSSSVAGVRLVAPGVVFSHHATDPAYNVACSAFDLMRIHRFGELDRDVEPGTPVNRRPSQEAALEFASGLQPVLTELIGQDFVDDLEVEDWLSRLEFNSRTGALKDNVKNWDLLRANWFPALGFNEMTHQVEALESLPWRAPSNSDPAFTEVDLTNLCLAVEREFKLRPSREYVRNIVDAAAARIRINPVRDYLSELTWDGTPRVETCLPGAADTPYNRLVARKTMVAAVARIFEPGIKWDFTTIFYGSEGLGKTYWIDRMARGYSTTLGNISDKDTLLKLQKAWVAVADEGFSLRKADSDAMKEFLTRRVDTFRAPYGRAVADYPRHCVIWGTTNDPIFLRRQEGNRRYLIVHTEERVDFDALDDGYIDQVWAEAVTLYQRGERLYLDEAEEERARASRKEYTEEDPLEGLIEEYSSLPVPRDWSKRSVEARLAWLDAYAESFVEPGKGEVGDLCTVQVWTEVLRRPIGQHSRADLLNIGATLRAAGYVSLGTKWHAPYGTQQVYTKNKGYDDLI